LARVGNVSSSLDGVEWILFDAVGTLIFPQPGVAEFYWAAGERFGSGLSVGDIRRRFGEAFRIHYVRDEATDEARERERWRRIVVSVFDDVREGAEELFESLWGHFSEPGSWRTYDDVLALAELKARGFRIGIASNFDGRLKGIVRELPLLAACEAVFASSSVGFSKPDGRFFQEIEKRLGVEAGRIALVGDDGVNDVEGAKGAGWRAVRVDRGANEISETTIRSLWELV
jgi:putative hydrolase of the HAD superfamily